MFIIVFSCTSYATTIAIARNFLQLTMVNTSKYTSKRKLKTVLSYFDENQPFCDLCRYIYLIPKPKISIQQKILNVFLWQDKIFICCNCKRHTVKNYKPDQIDTVKVAFTLICLFSTFFAALMAFVNLKSNSTIFLLGN